MTRHTALAVGVAALLAVASISTVAGQQPGSPYPPAKPQAMAPAGTVARGAQLVMLGGCNDCHTPKLQNGPPTCPARSRDTRRMRRSRRTSWAACRRT